MAGLSLLIAFVAGVVSFASPCCLPLVPAYLGYMVGADPAIAAQKMLWPEGIPSPLIMAPMVSTTIPEKAASISTWYWWLLRAACPPLKSPLPHTAAEVMANKIPSRSLGIMSGPIGFEWVWRISPWLSLSLIDCGPEFSSDYSCLPINFTFSRGLCVIT